MEDLKYWWFPVVIFVAIMATWGVGSIFQDATAKEDTADLGFRLGFIVTEVYDTPGFAEEFAGKHPDWVVRPGTYANDPVYWVYCEKPALPIQFVEQGYWERWPTNDE